MQSIFLAILLLHEHTCAEASSGFEKPFLSGDFFKKSPDKNGFSKPELASAQVCSCTHLLLDP
jgi:hypothetical protein